MEESSITGEPASPRRSWAAVHLCKETRRRAAVTVGVRLRPGGSMAMAWRRHDGSLVCEHGVRAYAMSEHGVRIWWGHGMVKA